MSKTGPIVVIEDDIEDQHALVEVFEKLAYPNKVLYFADGETALNFLSVTQVYPFLILADINMPKLNGIEVRDRILSIEPLRNKCIPYVFFTTASDRKTVGDAHCATVQGFFKKPSTTRDLERTIRTILEYWHASIAPNDGVKPPATMEESLSR